MHNHQERPYFYWGSADPNQYGLYSPVLDRFLLVDSEDTVLDYVAFLMSSKINLFVIPLYLSPNFQHNLIDNTCCLDWGVTEWPTSPSRLLPKNFNDHNDYHLDCCGRLIQKPNTDLSNIHELQSLAWLTKRAADFFRGHSNTMYTKFYDLISLPFGSMDYVKQQEKKCFDLLYHANSCQEVADQVEAIINDNKIVDLLIY